MAFDQLAYKYIAPMLIGAVAPPLLAAVEGADPTNLQNYGLGGFFAALIGVVLWFAKRDAEKDAKIEKLINENMAKMESLWQSQTDTTSRFAAVSAENERLKAELDKVKAELDALPRARKTN